MSYIFENTLNGKVALVTGASRGIGRGIAKILVDSGAKVYITGRKKSDGENNVKTVAEELSANGGKCIHIFCDHYNDEQVDALFKKIDEDENGKLDILVNNAFTGVNELAGVRSKKFWEAEPAFWDKINIVGLRSNYYCGVLAAKMMVKNQSGLIVNISSVGGLVPLFGVAYGVGKEGTDRMSLEMSLELKTENVCVISLWPGMVKTEAMSMVVQKNPNGKFGKNWHLAEDPTLSGKAISAIAADKSCMEYTGKVVVVAEVAQHYDFYDVNGKYPVSFRSVKYAVESKFPGYGWFLPSFLKAPGWLVQGYFHKF